MHSILVIWRKELRDTIRDRRTLLVMLVVPILIMPLLFVTIGSVSKSTAVARYSVAVSGTSSAPGLLRLLQADARLRLSYGRDPVDRVKVRHADAGLVIPAGFEAVVRASRPASIQVVQNTTSNGSGTAVAELEAVLGRYSAGAVAARLAALHVPLSVLTPVGLGAIDVSTKQERGGFLLSFILPLFIVLWSITGGMYTAMDVSAGEKERSTLEALLLTPATRLQITLGKLMAVSTVAFITIVAALSSMVYSLARFPIADDAGGQFRAQIDPSILPLIFLLGILLALAFSALELALGILARSFKEAQSYITPLYLASFIPVAVINSIPGLKPPPGLFLIPGVNAVLLFKEALLGHTDPFHAAVTLLSLLVFASVAVAITVFMFTREQVLLKT